MVFSDTSLNQGIVQETRGFMRVDSTQWPTAKIVASSNNWLDFIIGYAIGADSRFQWDDTNHTKLPEGTTDFVINQSDYSFLTDEQGNPILTLLGVSRLDSATNTYVPLDEVDRSDDSVDLATFGTSTGIPTCYDKIADNIIRLDKKATATVANGLKFYFQRAGSYFAASDTTKQPGVAPMLHRGFVVASAYDGALTLGLPNLAALATERAQEVEKMKTYFGGRNNDVRKGLTMKYRSFR